MRAEEILYKQGPIESSGLNNENNEIKMKNEETKIKDFIFNSIQWLKLTFSELKRKIKFINKQRRHTIFFYKKVLIF